MLSNTGRQIETVYQLNTKDNTVSITNVGNSAWSDVDCGDFVLSLYGNPSYLLLKANKTVDVYYINFSIPGTQETQTVAANTQFAIQPHQYQLGAIVTLHQ